MVEWSEVTVDKIASSARNALVGGPFGSNLVSRDYSEHGVPVIRGQNMGQRWVGGGFVYVTPAKAKSLESNIARPGDVVFTQRGTLGQVSIIPEEPFDQYLISQSQMKLTVDREVVDPLFIYYVFRSEQLQDYIRQQSIQTGVPHTNLAILRSTPILLPPLPDQLAIVHILGPLDDKIELNQQMNKTLEAIGQAAFKHWFIDFEFPNEEGEPYKSSGGEMVYNEELGKEIPKGWRVERLGNLLKSLETGRRPKGGIDQTLRDGIPSIGAENINGLGFYDYSSTKYISQEYFEQMKQGIVKDKDVLLYKDGAQLGRKTIFGEGFPFITCCVNEHVFILRGNEELNQLFLYFWLDQNEITENIKNLNANSAQPGINKESLGTLEVLVPRRYLLDDFEGMLDSVFDKLFLNCLEARNLSQIRDSLLPKLMSGKIRVSLEVR